MPVVLAVADPVLVTLGVSVLLGDCVELGV